MEQPLCHVCLCYLDQDVREYTSLEAAIGIEPMNKGFAVLKSQFLCVIRHTAKNVSIRFSLLEPASKYV